MGTATNTPRPAAAPAHRLPPSVVQAWQTTYLRVKGLAAAEWLWDWVLTPDDRRRLGGDVGAACRRYGGAAGMWAHLHGVSTPRAVVGVAARCGLIDPGAGRALLRALGEDPTDPDGGVGAAVAAGGLVLVEVPRRAYWAGDEVGTDWGRHARPWALLWELARACKAGDAVDALAFTDGPPADPKYVTKLKSRLVTAAGFPAALAGRVVPAGRGTYRLDLPPARVRVFERGAADGLREWEAWPAGGRP